MALHQDGGLDPKSRIDVAQGEISRFSDPSFTVAPTYEPVWLRIGSGRFTTVARYTIHGIDDGIETGAYSDVFRPTYGVVFKLFLNGKHPRNLSQSLNLPKDDERRRQTFL
jgi:hypothetical protein